ncbi:chromosome segregation protein SMC [Dolosicoccus paucivorans]|uniref:chromosome segregation protein SMC n=1 Tax=Dolosicoccus paucivorans TaxID=84521 RepID=UPI000C7FFD53|nr:chromosome segregation protein SMC [Dolosicoccus paucivorans]PMB84281.1 chromosome segregation protein SMC [Dolosicoccus paucivorans]
MYLDRIEMTGFKSFADKTVIEFDKGLTAVVGPNGSGKSNLSEAIRWVLGEQSAKSLRGDRMEDVIFNGTQDRRPVNMAKVTLVLNNEDRYLDYDFNEISITRSYNRNGDSQYLINQQPVRLKDIIDLLLDSGLGKNSFAMISQGKVESIFLSKPEERRAIFEEAAGVQRYQLRKQEAERKITRSKDHLSRVEDIIYELEKQITPLEKQRDDAMSYQKLTAQLKEEEISLYTYQIETHQQTWHQAQKEDDELKQAIQTAKKEMDKVDQELSATQDQIEHLNQTIDSSLESYHQWTYQQQKNESQEAMLNQQLSFNEQSKADQEKNRQAMMERQQRATQLMQTLEEEKGQLKDDYDQLAEQKETLQQQLDRLKPLSQEEMEKMRQSLLDWYQQEVKATSTIDMTQNQIQKSQQQIEQLHEEFKQQISRRDELEHTVSELSKQKQKIQHQLDKLRENYRDKKLRLDQRMNERKDLTQQLFDKERLIQRTKANVQSLEQMQEDYAGYYAGVRAVMTAQQLTGIDGTVADLMNVPTDYQTAIDTALGASLQTVIVQDDLSARHAIQYLKQNRLGRATFLPRSNAKPRALSQSVQAKAQTMDGWVGVASELIQFNKEDQPIIGQLLGNTIVADHIKNAQQMAKAFNHTVKIVTLSGELLLPGGTVSGGRNQQERRSMLSRKDDLIKAQKQLANETAQLNHLEKDLDELTEKITQLNTQLDMLTKEGQETDQVLQQTQTEHQKAQQTLTDLDRLGDIHRAEEEELKATITQAKTQEQQAKELQQTARQTIDELQLTLDQATQDESKQQAKRQQLNEERHTLTTQLSIKEVELKELNRRLKEQQQEYQALSEQLAQFEATFDEDQMNTDQIHIQLEELAQKNQEAIEQISFYKQQADSLRKERQVQQQTIKQLEQHAKEGFDALQTLYQQQASKQAQVERLGDLIDEGLEYLNQTYQLSYEAAKKTAHSIDNVAQVKQSVQHLKAQIDTLGPINLNAIEAYDELKERYDHLTDQQTDLLTAIEQLEETIEEMDKQVMTRFKEAFDKINAHFQTTFKELFGGGNASLELTDPHNLLTTGVEIIAQPPGKKMQNLALLSGGERAFTAIALLFSILKARPVPFVVLDEVEAALDEANVYRYGEYLQSFAQQTQFIVITHRKGTMEHADMLYGVTMQQSGVSKLASVRLADYVEE